jgi:hypothetical protein
MGNRAVVVAVVNKPCVLVKAAFRGEHLVTVRAEVGMFLAVDLVFVFFAGFAVKLITFE